VDVEVLETPHQLLSVDLSVSIIVQDAEHSSDSSDHHRASALQLVLDLLHHLLSSVPGYFSDGLFGRRFGGQLEDPVVLVRHRLVCVLTDLVAGVLICQNLRLVLGGLRHRRNFKLIAEVVSVSDLVVGEALASGSVLEHDALVGTHGASEEFLAVANCGNDLPHGVVNTLGVEADFLEAREAGVTKRGDLLGVQVEGLV